MNKPFFYHAKNILLILSGTLLLSFGTAVFILPFELVVGGVSGFAISLHHLLPWDFITLDLLIALLTWLLFGLGWLILGRGFAAKTLLSGLIYPLGITLFSRLTDLHFFDLRAGSAPQLAMLLGALFGGMLIGTGCALTFLGGGSTGGVDVIAFSLCKFFPRLRSPQVLFCIDAAAILLGMAVLGDLARSLLGIGSAFLSALAVDRLFLGGNRAFIAQILSERHDAIRRAIICRLGRTTTILPAKGGYSGKEQQLLQVSFTKGEYAALQELLRQIDSDAFITIHAAHEISGRGWTF